MTIEGEPDKGRGGQRSKERRREMTREERNTMVTNNIKLVGAAIHLFARDIINLNHPMLQCDDLYQIGTLALMKAAEKYDPEKGTAFSTFAMTIIKNDFLKEVIKVNRLSQSMVISVDDQTEDEVSLYNRKELAYTDAYTDEDIRSLVATMEKIQHWHETSKNYKLGMKITLLRCKGYDSKEIMTTLHLSSKDYYRICSYTQKLHKSHRDEFNWIPE